MEIQNGGELCLSKDALRELASTVLHQNVPFRIRANGSSMSPMIKNGDIIVISPLRDRKPICGDVLAFVDPVNQALTVHRLIKNEGNCYFFRGDNSNGNVEITFADQLIGRLINVERNGVPVHLGLGPERILIGRLNRGRGFSLFIKLLRKIYRVLQKGIR
ncbi:MAG TPA: S24/S26 family peptidase [bacterium]|nr:S24/S26 family peptidase [bacterium]